MSADKRTMLSALWVFATLNYLYCDVLALMDPELLGQILKGKAGGMSITQGFLLGASVLMEIPIAMAILSRVLRQRAARLANIAAGTIMTAVQIGSLFVGSGPTAYYCFFSAVEIACTAFIAIYAWRWREPAAVEAPAS
jgi:hypothetical protein